MKPSLDEQTLARLRAPAERSHQEDEDYQDVSSSDEEGEGKTKDSALPGTFPSGSDQTSTPYY